MPYISVEDRSSLKSREPQTVGELNYTITNLLISYIQRNKLNYETINALVGVLECAKLEMYRRLAVPYENEKIIQNGDVY